MRWNARLAGAALAPSVGIVVVSWICFYAIHVDATIAAIVLLLGVLVASGYQKWPHAILTSITATLCLDYYFIPPIGSITIGDPQGWIALTVFLTVSLLATNLSSRLRRQRDELSLRQAETERLHALSRSMLLSSGGEDVRRLIVNKCIELFGFREAVLYETTTGHFYRSQQDTSFPDEKLRRVALYGSLEFDESGEWGTVPITLGNKNLGSLAFRNGRLSQSMLQAIGTTVALGLAQAQAQEAASRAEAVRKSEELKSVMIDAIAHDLKTPLTAVEAAAEMLLHSTDLSREQRYDLLEIVQEEARGLRRIVDEAIHLARIDAKKLKLECQLIGVDDVIARALESIGERAASHRFEIDIPDKVPFVFADRDLIAQALKQLLDNAVKYSPLRSVITIAAVEANGVVSISVRDQGQGLTELEQGRVFDKFYRGRYDRSTVQGTGMGLAIAKEIVEAHNGHMGIESQVGRGSRFTISLHSAPQPVERESQPA